MSEFIESTFIDGYAGGPHIKETQIRQANQAAFGPDDYVLEGGRESEAQILTNNSIRIFDAVYCIQGGRDVIAANDYTDVTISNGAQGVNRNDIIVRRYQKDESSEEETMEYAVIKGVATSGTAEDPEVVTGDIRNGATLHEMKLYRVKIQGLNIVALEPLFKVLYNKSTIQDILAGKQDTITGGASTITSKNLTASRVLVSNSSGKVAVASITSTELGRLDGVKSNIQTQIDNKINLKCRTTTHAVSFEWTDDQRLLVVVDNTVVASFKNGTSI